MSTINTTPFSNSINRNYIETPLQEDVYNLLIKKSDLILKSHSKRALDIFVSIVCLVFLFPILFTVIAILIKLNSRGPVLFVQKRIGLNNRVFNCFKFRTMYLSKSDTNFRPVSYTDSRITSIGSFLRKTNLDELPQIINVIRGDMSIVGPRPHAIAFHEEYSTFVEYIDHRHLVKPGITGLAQIHGLRGDSIDKKKNIERTTKRIMYDIEYIKRYSFFEDIRIILITFYQMLTRSTNGF